MTINRQRCEVTVRKHLDAQGFLGNIDVETDVIDGRAVTVVRHGRRSVPWTGHVKGWLRHTLADLPGATVQSHTPQAITVTWDGA